MLNLHLWQAGCGSALWPGPGGSMSLPLAAGHPLKSVLQGSRYDGDLVLTVNSDDLTFQLRHADPSRMISGDLRLVAGAAEVATIQFDRAGLSVRLSFDANRRITRMESSSGTVWTPATADVQPVAAFAGSGVDAYLAANPELVNFVRQTSDAAGSSDGPGVTTGGSGGGNAVPGATGAKAMATAQAIPGDLSGIIGTLGLLLGLQGAVAAWPVLLLALQIVVAVNLSMGMLNVGNGQVAGDPISGPITGGATLRVINDRADGVPVWFVVLLEDAQSGLPGGNLLGEEAIPAGETRDFAVPPGVRSVNIISPLGAECFEIFRRDGTELVLETVTELVIQESDTGQVFPSDCIASP